MENARQSEHSFRRKIKADQDSITSKHKEKVNILLQKVIQSYICHFCLSFVMPINPIKHHFST